MEFKDKAKRTECYQARDAYFECIEHQSPGEKQMAKEACRKFYDNFEQLCGAKWTEHFVRKHDYLKFKEKLYTEGVDAVDAEKVKPNK